MTKTATVMELQPADRRKSHDARDDQGHDTPPRGDILMERILAKMNIKPREEVLKRIAFLSNIRRGKVLRVRRQVTDGTYGVVDRLEKVIDRVLEAISA
jgi:hypothetical protein